MKQNSLQVLLIKEKEQFNYLIPTTNPSCEFSPDGTGRLIQDFNFQTMEFSAIYIPSEEDWVKGIVIIKIDDDADDTTTIIELKLVEYVFPADIIITNNKFLKFKKYDRFKDVEVNLKFNFKMYYIDDEENEIILIERNNNTLNKAPSLTLLLSDNVTDEIKVINELKYDLKISLMSDAKGFLNSTQDVIIQ